MLAFDQMWGLIKSIGGVIVLIIIAVAIFSGGGKKEEKTTAPASAQSGHADSGRMSQGEFTSFRDAHQGVVDEGLQFSEGLQKCAVIGSAGELAAFSDCVDESYSGFEDKAGYADFTAQDLLDDTGRTCRAALVSYRVVLNDLTRTLGDIHRAGSLLQVDAMAAEAPEMAREARRYGKFAGNALRACKPR